MGHILDWVLCNLHKPTHQRVLFSTMSLLLLLFYFLGGRGGVIYSLVFLDLAVSSKLNTFCLIFFFPLPKECGAISVLYHHWTKFTQAKQVAFEPTIHNLLLGLQLIPSCFCELFRFGHVNCTGVDMFAIIEPDDNKHKWTTSQYDDPLVWWDEQLRLKQTMRDCCSRYSWS